jgi:hypothetical protein
MGQAAGACNTTGYNNTFLGKATGFYNTTGNNNNFFGDRAGCANTTGSNNLFFGSYSGVGATGLANITTQSNRIIMGNSAHTCAQIQIGWSTVSDIRDKCIFGPVPHGKGFLSNVNPIAYSFKNRETGEISDTRKRYGFSAQEISQLEGDNPVIASIDDTEKLSLTPDYIIPVLVNAIKELTKDYEALKAEVEELKKRL